MGGEIPRPTLTHPLLTTSHVALCKSLILYTISLKRLYIYRECCIYRTEGTDRPLDTALAPS